MKKRIPVILFIVASFSLYPLCSEAQCSICTKTTQQLGEKPARGMNSGIIYLAFAPLAIIGYLTFRWWKNNRASE